MELDAMDNELQGEFSKELAFKKYAYDELSRFRKLELVQEFLGTLSEKQQENLASWLASWRGFDIPVGNVETTLHNFQNVVEIKHFLDSLDFKQMRLLMKWLSRWRTNGVYENILSGSDVWRRAKIPIEYVILPLLGPEDDMLAKKNKYLLENIASDPLIKAHPSFNQWQEMHSKIVIGVKLERHYRILDGAHRATRLAQDGAKEIDMIFNDDVNGFQQAIVADYVGDPGIINNPHPGFSFQSEKNRDYQHHGEE